MDTAPAALEGAIRMTVIVGQLLDALGCAQRREAYQPPSVKAGPASVGRVLPGFQVRSRSWATPATELRRSQPASHLNIDHDNGRTLGPIIWLERDLADRCWAVCTTEHDALFGTYYFSAETNSHRDGTDVVITGLGLVRRTAQTCLDPVTVLPGELDDYRRAGTRRELTGPAEIILGHAAEQQQHHRHAGLSTLTVHDLKPPQMLTRSGLAVDADGEPIPVAARSGEPRSVDPSGRPVGAMWIRPSQIISVGGRPVRPR